MIILTYISGLMTALLALLLVFAVRAYRKYTLLLELNDESNEFNFERYEEMEEWMEDTESDLDYIRENMENDNYKNMRNISENVDKLNHSLNQLREEHTGIINNIRDTNDKIVTSLYNDLNTLKKQIIHLGSDPNTISRY